MKFLELPELDILSRALALSTPNLKVSTRLEAYSCKAISREKKLIKLLESNLIQDISHSTSVSPPENHKDLLESCFGPLNQPKSRKTLWLLIGLLNLAFPDFDFNKVRPEEFKKEGSVKEVLTSLSSALEGLKMKEGARSFVGFQPSSEAFPIVESTSSIDGYGVKHKSVTGAAVAHPFIRQILDPIIDLEDCEVYSYAPDMDSDPHAYDSDSETEEFDTSNGFEADETEGEMFQMEGLEINNGISMSLREGQEEMKSGYGYLKMMERPATPTPESTPSKQKFKSRISSSFSAFPPSPSSTSLNQLDLDEAESSTGGLLWSTNYFLFNKKKKRILFISIWAKVPAEFNSTTTSLPSRPSLRKRRVSGLYDDDSSSEIEISEENQIIESITMEEMSGSLLGLKGIGMPVKKARKRNKA